MTSFDTEANDNQANGRDLGTDVTDALGEFVIAYFAGDNAGSIARGLRFRVRWPSIEDPVEVTQRIKPDAQAPVGIRISLAGALPTLRQLGGSGHIDLPDAILATIEGKHGIRSLADIRRIGGLVRIAELRTTDLAATIHLNALAAGPPIKRSERGHVPACPSL